MVESNNQSEVKVYLYGTLTTKSEMLIDLGIEVINDMYAEYSDVVNHINNCSILVADDANSFPVGYMYARMQVYDTFENMPKERKPQLVIIGEPFELADVINLPTWETFLRWLKG